MCAAMLLPAQVLIDYQAQQGHSLEKLEGEQRPTHIVHSLIELLQLLRSTYSLVPPPQPHAAVMQAT